MKIKAVMVGAVFLIVSRLSYVKMVFNVHTMLSQLSIYVLKQVVGDFMPKIS